MIAVIPSCYQTLKVDLPGIIPSKLSKIHSLFIESNLVLTFIDVTVRGVYNIFQGKKVLA